MKNMKTEESKRRVILVFLVLVLTLVLLLHITSSINVLPRNISATENVTRPDEWIQWQEIQEIKNYTNRSIPLITIGGVNTLYGDGETLTVYASITLHGEPVDPENYCNLTITRWNGSSLLFYLNSTNMTRISTGWYHISWTVPTGTKHHGTYGVLVEADPLGKRTQATAGFKAGFELNVSVTLDVADIWEMLDCDGSGDSPICSYTQGLQSSVDKIQDMLNCSNLGNNSDLCDYAERIENNLTRLTQILIAHNNTVWDKLLDLEMTINAINSNTTAIWDALNCDNSPGDVCNKIESIQTLTEMINVTTKDTLRNVTYLASQFDVMLANISTIRDYVETLILEFNCSLENPSDVCYRLELIQNATGAGSLADILAEINATIHETLTMVNYINEVRWGNFSYTQPVPTVLILQGKIKRLSTGQYISVGSLQVNITDAYVPTVIWSHEYNDVIRDNMFNILLGGTYDLSLIPKRKYKRDISICDGITFDPSLYTCETFTTYFIA